MNISSELLSASLIAVRDCMGVRSGERVLVITDEPLRIIGLALRQAAHDLGNDVVLVEMLPRSSNGEEPPGEIADLMKRYDVVLCPTSKSLTHTDARRSASEAGVRIATLPGVTEEIMVRCMNADYRQIARRTERLCARMEKTSVIRVTTKLGTDITMPIAGRKAYASTGLFTERGQSGNLPTGEAFLAPWEGESRGVVIVDGSFASLGMLSGPLTITVKDGFAVEVAGRDASRLTDLWAPHGNDARNVAEFGIGTNDKAILSGKILEDEKVMGTIHIAFGDNKSMGGSIRVASHLDGLVKSPSVYFDNVPIMVEGTFVIED